MGVCNQQGSPASPSDTVIWVESGGGMGAGVRSLDDTF